MARPYQLLTLGLNLGVLCVALLAVWLVRLCYLPSLAALQEDYRLRDWGLRFCAALRLRFCFRCSTGRRSAGKSIA